VDRNQEVTQKRIDFARGEQLRYLRDCDLPRDAKDSRGHGVSAMALKTMLSAIDNFARGRPGGCYASVRTLAATANMGHRTATRAIEILEQLSLICRENDDDRHGLRGSPTNRYTIVWSELARFVDRYPLFTNTPPRKGRGDERIPAEDQSALRVDHSALGTDQSAPRAEQSALGTDQSAPRAHETTKKRLRSATEAPSDVRELDVDGARYFFSDELEAIRQKANTLNRWVRVITIEDRAFVLKVATLWQDGLLAEDQISQVLESFERKARELRNPVGWLWQTLRNQCRRYNVRLEQLLARSDFPRELLTAPRPNSVADSLASHP
jgi:hypothetical protein